MARPDQARYWRGVREAWRALQREELWRDFNDRLISQLVDRWLNGAPRQVILKTDLFEESCSDGLYGVLSRCGSRLVAMDLASAIVLDAKRRHPLIEATVADVQLIPFDDETFDLIVSPSTLDHFDDLDEMRRALAEMVRVLRPTGELLMTLDNLDNPVLRLRSWLPSRWLRALRLVPYDVGRSCGRRRLRRLLGEVGLEVREMTAVLHVPRLPAVVTARALARSGPRARERFIRWAGAFERLEATPLRSLTGYFVAARAVKPQLDPRSM
jgi:SAM-dependent methyltransferase